MTKFRVLDNTAIICAAVALALTVTFAVKAWSLLPEGVLVFALFLVGAWTGIGLRHMRRVGYAYSISYYTVHGVLVRLGDGPWVSKTKVEEATSYAVIYACKAFPGVELPRVAEAFDGVTITVVKGKVADPRGGWARGLTDGKNVYIAHLPGDTEDDLLSRIRHEVAHVALNAAGAPSDQEEQHRIMTESGYGL